MTTVQVDLARDACGWRNNTWLHRCLPNSMLAATRWRFDSVVASCSRGLFKSSVHLVKSRRAFWMASASVEVCSLSLARAHVSACVEARFLSHAQAALITYHGVHMVYTQDILARLARCPADRPTEVSVACPGPDSVVTKPLRLCRPSAGPFLRWNPIS